MHDAFQSMQLNCDVEDWWLSLTSSNIVDEVWGYVKPKEWGNEVSSMVLSNFRSLHAVLSRPDIYLSVDHRYLWFAGFFVKQCAFQSEANIQQSDQASADFDDRTIIMVVWCPVFLMSGQNSWWWTSNNCDIVICHIEMTIILTRTLWGCFSGWGPRRGYYQLSLSDNHNHWPGHMILTTALWFVWLRWSFQPQH